MKKLFAVILTITLLATFCSVFTSAKTGTYDLVKNGKAGEDGWDVIAGTWMGPLNSGANQPAPTERTKDSNGYLVLSSPNPKNGNNDDGVGNYIGVSDILKPDTEYKLTAEIKFTSNRDASGLYSDPVYNRIVVCYGNPGDFSTSKLVSDTEGKFETVVLNFKTPKTMVAAESYVLIGPSSGASNPLFCAFCPGAELVIKSAVLEGDLLKSDDAGSADTDNAGTTDNNGGTENPPSGDAAVVAVAIAANAAAASAIVIKKKRVH